MSRQAWLVLILPAACTAYHPSPLRAPAAILTAPDQAVLSADAAKIDRPFLHPQPLDLSAPLVPEALAIIAVLENPDLKAQRAAVGVIDAQAFAARLLPDPQIQGNFDKLLSGQDPTNAYGAQFALDLSQLRSARVLREMGDSAKRQVRLDLAWAEWQVAGQARLLGARVQALGAERELAQESADQALEQWQQAQSALARGDLAGPDVDTRRQALLDAQARIGQLEIDLGAARGDLNHLLGLPPQTKLQLAPASEPAALPAAEKLVSLSLERRLDLQALRAGYASSEAALHKAVLDQFPNLALSLNGGRDTSLNTTLGPSVGFALPLWNRNRGGIAMARADRAQLQADYEARLFQTRADIDAAVRALASLRRQRQDIVRQMPATQELARQSRDAAARGDLSLAQALPAEQAWRDRRLALVQIDQQIAEQTIALELLSGTLRQDWTS